MLLLQHRSRYGRAVDRTDRLMTSAASISAPKLHQASPGLESNCRVTTTVSWYKADDKFQPNAVAPATVVDIVAALRSADSGSTLSRPRRRCIRSIASRCVVPSRCHRHQLQPADSSFLRSLLQSRDFCRRQALKQSHSGYMQYARRRIIILLAWTLKVPKIWRRKLRKIAGSDNPNVVWRPLTTEPPWISARI